MRLFKLKKLLTFIIFLLQTFRGGCYWSICKFIVGDKMYDIKWSRGSKRRVGRGTTCEAKIENGYEKWYILAWNSVRTWKTTRHLPPLPPPLKKKSELKIRRQRDSTTADLVEGAWGEVAVAMARKIALRKLARRRVVVAPFPVERVWMGLTD